MAFPLAHPAAVLPFRRHYLKWLNFPALVIGSLVPDIGYVFPGGDDFSHQVVGSILFGLPVGGLILAAFYAFRTKVVARMPAVAKQAILPLCNRPCGPVWIMVLSLIIGGWTHVLWDSVTHPDGALVQHVPLLLFPVFRSAGRMARVCTVLWYGSSFAGVACIFSAFEKWKQNVVVAGRETGQKGKLMLQDAILAAVLVIPVSLVHHLIGNPIGSVLTAASCVSFGVLLIWKMAAVEI
jgi:hypothetical protein